MSKINFDYSSANHIITNCQIFNHLKTKVSFDSQIPNESHNKVKT